MSRENKYLRDFLNLLSEDQVFYSYLTNTFMLNQIRVITKELNEGKKDEEEVEREIQDLIKSVEILVPDSPGMAQVNLSKDEFYNLLKTVKDQTIENLAERRRN